MLNATTTAGAQLRNLVIIALCVALLAGINVVFNDYIIRVISTIFVFMILAVSYNLINGVTGQLSLEPNGFVAVGAYVTALLILPSDSKLDMFEMAAPSPWILVLHAGFLPALLISGLCAAALLLSLLLAGTAKADEITIYLMAENDQMLDLPLSAMPAWINGDIYVPYTAFDWTVTGVNLGVSYGQERTETEYKFTLYSLNGMLVFDLNAGTCTDGFSGEAKDMRAALRNGRVFVPLAGVCSFFGLNYTYTPTNYGTLIRITNGQERLDTQQFVTSASGLSMPTRYYKYLQELNQGTQPTPSPSHTPSGGGTDEPEQEDGLPVYLSFQCTGGGALDNILDTLEARGIRALFLFTPDALAAAEGQLRRLVGSGHAVGLSVPGQSLDGARAALEEGAGLLEQLVRVRPHTVYLEGAASGVADALEREGWACWSANVDGRPDGRSQSTQANALLRTLEGRRSAARMLLDDSGESAGILSRLLPRMPRDAYWFQLALDTRI